MSRLCYLCFGKIATEEKLLKCDHAYHIKCFKDRVKCPICLDKECDEQNKKVDDKENIMNDKINVNDMLDPFFWKFPDPYEKIID